MKKIIDAIKKALGMDKKSDNSSKGFTLIELLVVIAVIGILAAATLIAIDPIDRLNAGKDSRVQQDVASIAQAMEQYAVTNNGAYPTSVQWNASPNILVQNGQLKSLPTQPDGTAYVYTFSATAPKISGTLTSKKYTNANPVTAVWKYTAGTGKSCAAAAVTNDC